MLEQTFTDARYINEDEDVDDNRGIKSDKAGSY